MDALSIGSNAAVSAIRSFDQAAARTVRDADPSSTPSPNGIGGNGDLVSDFVQQIQAQAAFQASVSVIKTADQMTGRLLDVKA